MSSNRTVFSPENHPTFHPSYSHICSTPLLPTSKLITIAGQIGRDSAANTTPSEFLEQVEIALKNVKTCLDAVSPFPFFCSDEGM
jgi:enamine deaminase RidA (YjgF/YER057c/UK114 family)